MFPLPRPLPKLAAGWAAMIVLGSSPFVFAENEIGYIERFALAADREKVLGELVPGSEEFYFFHALHYQNTNQAAKLEEILKQWAKRFPDSEQRKIIENRAALLGYDADPQKTLAYLRDKLNLQFNDVQEARDTKPDLPTTLDQKAIAREVFLAEALRSDSLHTANLAALERMVRDKVSLTPPQRRALLVKMVRPDLPNLLPLILEDLKSKESRGFGEFAIHLQLLPEQLDELAKQIPGLAENSKFVNAKLSKLAPNPDADAEFDPAVREAWLESLWAYVRTLSPSFNTLKGAILYQRLQFDRSQGVLNKERFVEYLKLPRPVEYVNPEWLRKQERSSERVDLNAAPVAVLPPIGNDEALVRAYLLDIFKDEPSWEPWAAWLRETWVKTVFAEAKIVNGVGNPEQWASLLSPAAFQALKERVDVDFAAVRPALMAPNDPVNVTVLVKNVPKLIVKTYEINTLNYFLNNKQELNTDLSLDGLVANREEVHDFSADGPFRRIPRSFDFPELKDRRGAWVIDFIGGGKSSRMLVRKGQWQLLQQTGPAGDQIAVIDEQRNPVKDAVAWLDGRKFTPDEKTGWINIPFTAQPGREAIVLADPSGAFACLSHFTHSAENYALDAQFYVEREQLLEGNNATLVIRTGLLLGNCRLPMELLQDVNLRLTITTLDGISTTQEIKAPKLSSDKLFTHSFSVPDRAATVSVQLSGKIPVLSEGDAKRELSAADNLSLNGIDKTDATNDAFLSRFENNYVFELLGKNGEPLKDQQIQFQFRHREFERPVYASLRTDEKGRANLGPLNDIGTVEASLPNGRRGLWRLAAIARTPLNTVHALAGEVIQIPWDGGKEPLSLLETRNGVFVKALRIVPPTDGFLKIQDLPPGDYSLVARGEDPLELTIQITAGKRDKGWILSPNRLLQDREAAPIQVQSVSREGENIVVKVANANPYTRVHIAATRFVPISEGAGAIGLFNGLSGFLRFSPGEATPGKYPNLYAAGREIGDEYRYILERRYSRKFPGNMLTRPGLLLNPWQKRIADQVDALAMQSMDQFQKAGGGRSSGQTFGVTESAKKRDAGISGQPGSSLDFLAEAAPVLYNLVPDKDGVVRIERKALGDRQHLQIYVEDLSSAVWKTLALAEVPTKFRDLRLLRNLDPQKPFSEKKEVTFLNSGQTLNLPDILTSDLETYDTIGGIYGLFTVLNSDANLAKFAWILRWPSMDEAEKRAKYSEFACHELSFFLSRKDRPFFEKVILPYLRNKKDKTFMDDYLLSNDLKRYLEPWAYARLNMAERCLLAQRIQGETANTARHLRELWELLPPNPDRQDQLFETALRGRALSGGGEQDASFKREKTKAKDKADKLAAEAVMAEAAIAPPAPAPRSTPPSVMAREEATTTERIQELEKALQAAEAEKALLPEQLVAGLDFDDASRQRLSVRPYYRKIGPTREWAENNYYQLPIEQQNADLVKINGFWRDYAAWDGKTPFVSTATAEATGNFTEMMLALAVLDLPFEAPKPEEKSENGGYTLTARGPTLAYHKQIKPAVEAKEKSELLVSQNFYRNGDRYRMEGNEKFDKYVTAEFLAGAVYGANIVVTNPTSSPQKLEVLLQIPQGALPVRATKATDSKRLRLEPYTTQTFDYFFYFPAAPKEGVKFPHYPVHVSQGEQIVGEAKPFAFNVVWRLTQFDKASWDYVSQYGTDEEVFTFLDQNNLERLDLGRVAWRCRKSVDFFRRLVRFMEKNHVYSNPIYRYAVLHNDTPALREWLKHQDAFVAALGAWINTALLHLDPIERRAYEHLEYWPLVNQRVHRLGPEYRIANPIILEQYQKLLNILSYKSSLDPMDQMSVVYYLFLQDRAEEALERFHTVKADSLPTRLQFDYFRCYASFYEQQPAEARTIATQYADFPVDRWRKLFTEVSAQADEIEGKTPARTKDDQPDREKEQAELAGTEPSFDFKTENRTISLTWQNLGEVTINYYLIDPEFSFSANPFVSEETSRFSIIVPNKTVKQALPAGKDALEIPLPEDFAKSNVLIEVLGAGQRKAEAYHANTMTVTMAENYGLLDVREAGTSKPISKAYVKVYARLTDGTVRFFKDGYTDLRGKFDYVSLNSPEAVIPLQSSSPAPAVGATLDHQMLRPDELDSVQRLAVLVLSETNGAEVKEVDPPSQ